MTAQRQKNKTRDMVYIALFTVIIIICAWIVIPMAVPFTLQLFAVFLTVSVLGGKRGCMAVLLYLLLGAVGLPVFSGFTGGIGWLLGNTGGYLMGFLAAALVMWGMEALWSRSTLVLAGSMAVGLLVCYAVGTCWYLMVYTDRRNGPGVMGVLSLCVFPFVIPDVIKIVLVFLVRKRLLRVINRN